MRVPAKPYPLERLFQALADRTRLRLLHLMAKQEVCVCYFVEVLQAPQPKISRHLAYLRRAGLVTARREGKWMHYRLVQPTDLHAAAVLKTTLESLQQDKAMLRDLAHLQKACCGSNGLVELAAMAERLPKSLATR
jgi:ArsR family transcriptional regulator